MHQWEQLERRIILANDPAVLRSLRTEVHEAFGSVLTTEAAHASAIVNRLHDAFIAKSLTMAEERVRTSYPGVPPVSSFAVLLFGSGGRGEQTLWSDQDNGLVFEAKPGADPAEAEAYMSELGHVFRSQLEAAGYPPCEGDVLVTNPAWRKSLAAWKLTLAEWFDNPEFETVRHMLILADARSIYGNRQLAAALRAELTARVAADRATILPRMLQNTLRYKVLLGVLGNLLTEPYGEDAGGIDIKYGAYIPMVNAIRLLSLAHDVRETSTLERIKSLMRAGVITAEQGIQWEEAFKSVLKFRAMTPYQIEDGKYTTRGMLSSRSLTKEVRRELKDALRVGAELQRKLKRLYGTEGRL